MASPSLSGFERKVVVGIADLAAANNPQVILTTYSLGSCVAVSLYDPVARVGGLVHIMLPSSELDPVKAAAKPAMFADTALPELLHAMVHFQADLNRLRVCVAGGAQILDNTGFFSIGARNCEAVKRVLRGYGLQIHAEQLGGLVSRSMYLYVSTGEVRLKVSGQTQETVLCKS